MPDYCIQHGKQSWKGIQIKHWPLMTLGIPGTSVRAAGITVAGTHVGTAIAGLIFYPRL